MNYIATDRDGGIWLYSNKPIRAKNKWESPYICIQISSDAAFALTGMHLTWDHKAAVSI